MAQLHPQTEETEESREGTAAHGLGERLIARGVSTPETVPESVRSEYIDTPADNGVIITDEIFDSAWTYANDVVREIKARPGCIHASEHPVEAKSIHALSFGTVDQYLYYDRELIVWDFKHGHGVVDEFENWQLINYVAGLLEEHGIDGYTDQHITVRMRIVQPRAYSGDGAVREWAVKASDLRGYFNTLSNNAAIALGPNAPTRSGEHCKHCTARHACTAALTAGIQLFEAAAMPTPVELSAEALGVQLAIVKRARKQLEYLETGYEEQAKGMIRSGKSVAGWSLEPSYGREKWAKPTGEVLALGDLIGVDLRKPAQAITPKQAKDKGIDEAVISAYSERPSAGLKLTPADNKKAKKVFQ